MQSLYINPATNDLEFDGQNALKMVDGDDELLQSIREILRTNTGEWFLNLQHGLNRFGILGKKFDRERSIDIIYKAIYQESRIKTVNSIDLDYDRQARTLTVKFTAVKKDGNTIGGEVVI